MKFTFSISYFVTGTLLILIINYSTFLGESTTEKDISNISSTTTAELGSIENSIELVGDAELVDEQSLSFNKAGTITSVLYKAGDTVKKGATIAQIDNSDAYDSIEEAKISLENAQINLTQLYEPVDESKIIQANNSITTAGNNLENAKQELINLEVSQGNSLEKMLESIETSKKELEQLIQEKENSLENSNINKNSTIIEIEDDFKNNLINIAKIIEETDYILGVSNENKDKNDDFQRFLGAKNKTILSQAKTSLLLSISLKEKLENSLENYVYNGKKESITPLLEEYLTLYNTLYETTDYTYQTIENSIVSLGSLSESEINSMKNTMSSYRSSSLNSVSSIKKSINTLNTLTDTELLGNSNELSIQKQILNIENSQKSYQESLSSYALSLKTKKESINSKEVSLTVAKLNQEELLEGPSDDNIRKANNSIKQANIKLESAYESLEDYALTAPFDGVVRKIDYMVGDNLSNDTNKYIYIENPNLVEISVMLDQIDIFTVSLEQEAHITFDAFSTISVQAKISSIDTTPVQSSGVVSYEVKLILDDPDFDKKILSGMTANVEIITESRTNIILIKTTAIFEKDGKNYVTLEKDGKQVEVTLGIASGGKTEIFSGLKEGDIVHIQEFVTATSTEEETSASLFGSGPGGGGGGDRSGPPGGF